MPKRITYLEKRDGMAREDFRAHWSTTHADIARDLPGVTAYRQNHVQVFPNGDPGAGAYAVDGIVELWFADESAVQAGFTSDVSDKLAADETNFLSGLAGGAVSADEPYEASPWKLWLLARWQGDGEAGRDAVSRWAGSAAEAWPESHVSVNFLDADSPLLTRKALRAEPGIPQVAIAFCFTSEKQASEAADGIGEALKELNGVLENLHSYLAKELAII